MCDRLISIIVPVYNAGHYLRRCLDSLLNQTYGGKKEIIIVDDGSTDASGVICDEYAHKNAEVVVFHTDNRGASLARRFGLERASGEFVTFADSDDYVSPNYLSVLFGVEKKFNLGISACAIRLLSKADSISQSAGPMTPVILEGDELFHRFFKYEFWGFYGKLYRKTLLLEIPFPHETLNEDYNVMTHLLHNVGRMVYLDSPLYYYNCRQGSLSRQPFSSKSMDEYINVKEVYELVIKEMPQYRDYALANVVETAVKLLISSRKHDLDFKDERQDLKAFLVNHKKEILFCKPINRKTALLAFSLMV